MHANLCPGPDGATGARSTDPVHSACHVTSCCAWPQHAVVCTSALKLAIGSIIDFDACQMVELLKGARHVL